jgi:hypothetical protein
MKVTANVIQHRQDKGGSLVILKAGTESVGQLKVNKLCISPQTIKAVQDSTNMYS